MWNWFSVCSPHRAFLTVLIIIAHDFTLNSNRLVGKVDSIPPQIKHFTSSQTIVSRDMNYQFEFFSLSCFKQCIQLFHIIKSSFILICSRHNKFVHGVNRDVLHFNSICKTRISAFIMIVLIFYDLKSHFHQKSIAFFHKKVKQELQNRT